MKKCIRCEKVKEINNFYVHPKMRDGHLNKCIECCREVADLREKKLRENNSEWCESERLRSKEKYYRLGYGMKQLERDKLKPYKNNKYRNLFRDLNLSSDENEHHWNYNLIDDVIILNKKFHRFIHRYLILDEETLTFSTIEGNVLNSKEKHLKYIERIKIIYNNK